MRTRRAEACAERAATFCAYGQLVAPQRQFNKRLKEYESARSLGACRRHRAASGKTAWGASCEP